MAHDALSRSASGEGADCILMHPVTGRATDAVITVADHDSRGYADARRRLSLSGGEAERDDAALCAALTLGWRNVALAGKYLPYTPANADRLYRHPSAWWVIPQVIAHAEERTRFTTA